MSCRKLIVSTLMLFVVALVVVGCTTEVDYSLGSEYVPTNQNMELRRRVYRDGMMTEGGVTTDVAMAKTFLYQNDSIKSSNLDYVYFGHERSEVYGSRRAGFMSQVLFGSKLDEEYGWGYRPIFDSMTLAIYVTDYHGDTTKCRRYGVYEITSNDYLKIPELKDSIFYTNFNPSAYISSEPIFEFTYPNQEKGVFVGNMEQPHYEYVTLEETAATREYVSRLMFTTNLDDTDGYAKDINKIYTQGNEEQFVEQIRGVYIAPIGDLAADDNGAMFATDVENSALVLHARSRYEEDPTIIKDTVLMSYNFFINPVEYDIKAGNVSITNVVHEFVDEDAIENRSEVLVGKVDAMAGVVTEMEFTDEFLQSLADIAKGRKSVKVSVNQAHLCIYLEAAGYDYNFADPLGLADIMNASMARMGLYVRYGGYEDDYQRDIIAISDYLSDSSDIAYDGNLNRSLGCYKMDISSFMQALIMGVVEYTDDNGELDLEAFNSDEQLAKYRHLYIGPATNALFGFKHQTINGGDATEDTGDANKSPITLELTYTIVD